MDLTTFAPGFVLGVLAFAAVFCSVRWLIGPGHRLLATDRPGRRSLHDAPTATGGGIAIFMTVLVVGIVISFFYFIVGWATIGVAAFLVALISFVDDHKPLTPWLRLSVHIVASGMLMSAGLVPDSLGIPGIVLPLGTWLGIVFCGFYIVWMMNLYNFMDGMDGFAAGMSTIGFSTYALCGVFAGEPAFFSVSLVIAAASAGFLVFNIPPAKIFMGDVGASLLGLLMAVLTLWAERDGIFPLWVGVVVFSPFIVDATVTVIWRTIRGYRIWEGHRTHFYQRLVRLGWGHRRTVCWEYVLMVMCSAAALIAINLTVAMQWMLLSGWVISYIFLMCFVFRLETKMNKNL